MKNLLSGSTKVLIFLLQYVRTENAFSLSTASVRETLYAKPTSLHRRINVERSVQERPSTPLNLLRLRDPELKRGRSEVWIWDFKCQQQPKMGKCSESLPKYYYDAQLDQCLNFTYSGCNGNKNNFKTFVDCERHCKGAAYMAMKDTAPPTFCSLQPNAGFCVALLERYYFDVNAGTCKVFIYGGCGGNQNRFETKTMCLKRCSDSEYN